MCCRLSTLKVVDVEDSLPLPNPVSLLPAGGISRPGSFLLIAAMRIQVSRLPLSAIPDDEGHVDYHTGLLDRQLAGFSCFQNFGRGFQFTGFGFIHPGDRV